MIKPLIFLIGLLAAPALSAPITGGHASLYAKGKQANTWRLEVNVPFLTNYSVFLLDNPKRLVVDLLNEKIKPKKCKANIKVVRQCRVGKLDGKRARFVLDLKENIDVVYNKLVRKKGKRFLEIGFVVLDGSEKAEKEFVQKVEPIKREGNNRKKKFVIVLDPGHGGAQDSGASFGGMDEKDLVLTFSKELRRVLEKERNVEVRVTRTKDEYIPVRKRLMMVRARHADILISLHADWNANPDVKGIAVYSQSNYAAEKYARRFIENSNPVMIKGEEWQKAIPTAYDILFDITQRDTLNQSIFLSRSLLSQMRLYTPVLDQPHRFADLHLLSAPDVPAVLIELGFLSNKGDRKKITSKQWRTKLAERIRRGVVHYLKNQDKLKPKLAQNLPKGKKTGALSPKKSYNMVELK